MIQQNSSEIVRPANVLGPSVWGMDALQIHDQFWAAHGVQVVRSDDVARIDRDASLYLLLDPYLLVLFRSQKDFDRARRSFFDVAYVRLRDTQERPFRERVVTDEDGRFVKFERHYEGGPFSKHARVLVTRDPKLAAVWQMAPEPALAGKAFQQIVPRNRRVLFSATGSLYDSTLATDDKFFIDLIPLWKNPERAIQGIRQIAPSVWAHSDANVNSSARLIGPIWIGAGRSIEQNSLVVGPLALLDDPDLRPELQPVQLQPSALPANPIEPVHSRSSRLYQITKRVFDILVSLFALLLTLPLYPFIMAAIWLEDGRPFFFAHRRETLGGRKFPCLKFRSMRKDAEKIKRRLAKENGIDGPQFFMKQDPRLTRVGAFLRKRQFDELPQFINVLLGHMSIVGPRPSPYAENQFCPPWRDARLSVRPGITGLWQIKRTRAGGCDFQEWIRYDLDYVRKASLWFDLQILVQTALMFLGRLGGKVSH